MKKPPELYVIHGREEPAEPNVFRLRPIRSHEGPPVARPWPQQGAWRDLVRSLAKNPVKSEDR